MDTHDAVYNSVFGGGDIEFMFYILTFQQRLYFDSSPSSSPMIDHSGLSSRKLEGGLLYVFWKWCAGSFCFVFSWTRIMERATDIKLIM